MDRNPAWLYKTLVVGVIVLFIGLGVQPAIATVEPKTDIIDFEPKDYLFQTIIDISNNPDVKELLEQYDTNLFKVDIERSVYRKLLLRNPSLFFNMIFTKPSISSEYLNKCYKDGIEVTNIISEDKALEMIKNVKITDSKLFDELDNIISTDKELSERLVMLKEMNKVLDFRDNPIICGISVLVSIGAITLFWILFCPIAIISTISEFITIINFILGLNINIPIIELIDNLITPSIDYVIGLLVFISILSIYIAVEFDCIDWRPYY
jgi:hypothetical protein